MKKWLISFFICTFPLCAYSNSIQNPPSGVQITDESGNVAGMSLLGQIKIAESQRLVGGVFNDGQLDSNYFIASITNGGTASVSNGEAVLTLTASANSSSSITTVGIGRYIGANSNYFRSTARFGDTGSANNVRALGVYTGASPNDGFWFQLNGTNFEIVTMLSGTATKVSNGSFNGKTTTFPVTTAYHNYEIHYTAKTVKFVIDGILLHTVTALTSPISSTRNFKPFISNKNTGVGPAASLYAMNMTVNRLGPVFTQTKAYHQSGAQSGAILKIGPGTLRRVCVNTSTNGTTVSLYDAITATNAMAVINTPTGATSVCMNYDINFTTGLYLVQAGTTSDTTTIYE